MAATDTTAIHREFLLAKTWIQAVTLVVLCGFFVLGLLAYVAVRLWPPPRFSMMRVFGQTSLLVYWVHVELVYGLLFKHFANRLSMGWATVAFVLMTAAMLGLAVLRLKYWRGWRPAFQALTGRTAGQNLPSTRGPL